MKRPQRSTIAEAQHTYRRVHPDGSYIIRLVFAGHSHSAAWAAVKDNT